MKIGKLTEVFGDDGELSEKYWIYIILALFFVVVSTCLIQLAIDVSNENSIGGQERFGQIGDFFGGMLNPLVAFAAFYWLVRSVKIQKKELEGTKAELKVAGEAQKELVENGKKSIRLAALTSLVSAIDGEIRLLNERIGFIDPKLAKADSHNIYGRDRRIDDLGEERNGFVKSVAELEGERKALVAEMRQMLNSGSPH